MTDTAINSVRSTADNDNASTNSSSFTTSKSESNDNNNELKLYNVDLTIPQSKTSEMSCSSDDDDDASCNGSTFNDDGNEYNIASPRVYSVKITHNQNIQKELQQLGVPTTCNSQGDRHNKHGGEDVICRPWTRFTEAIHDGSRRFVVVLSQKAAYNPVTCVVSVILISLTILAIGFFTNFNINVDETEVYAPFNSIPQAHWNWRQTESGFKDPARGTVMIFHNHGENVLGMAQVRRLFEALNVVRNTEGYRENCEGGPYYDELLEEKTCRVLSVTRAWNHDIDLFDEFVDSDQDVIDILSQPEYPGGASMDHSFTLGDPVWDYNDKSAMALYHISNDTIDVKTAEAITDTTSGPNGTLSYVPAYFVSILLTDKGDETYYLEERIIENLHALRDQWNDEAGGTNQLIQLDFWTERSFGDEFLRAIDEDMYLVPAIALLMSAFTCFVFYKAGDRVHSRCLVGVGSVATIGMSLFSGFGLLFIIGVPFTSMTQLLPFLVMGVGVRTVVIL